MSSTLYSSPQPQWDLSQASPPSTQSSEHPQPLALPAPPGERCICPLDPAYSPPPPHAHVSSECFIQSPLSPADRNCHSLPVSSVEFSRDRPGRRLRFLPAGVSGSLFSSLEPWRDCDVLFTSTIPRTRRLEPSWVQRRSDQVRSADWSPAGYSGGQGIADSGPQPLSKHHAP